MKEDVFCKPWAILPERLQMIAAMAVRRTPGACLSGEEIRASREAATTLASLSAPGGLRSYGAIAVIPIRGIISHRGNLMSWIWGGTAIDKLTAQFRRALNDRSVKTIVFDVDSPGGDVEGVPELAEEILKSRSRKNSIAVANGMAASAAYWLSSAAAELVVAPSGQVGSIGVFIAHEDVSKALESAGVKISLVSAGKYKTDGNDIEPLSNSARADMQGKVDAFYGMFVKSVGRGRKASQEQVRGGFGQGRMVLAADAVKTGMADRVATMDDTIARLASGRAPGNRSMAAFPRLALRRRQLELACRDDRSAVDGIPPGLLRRELDLVGRA